MGLKNIKEAIEQLPDAELRQLLDWLDEREQVAWDAEMERDFAPDGRGASLVENVKTDVRAGKFKPMNDRRS
jgi:hypothetical protein